MKMSVDYRNQIQNMSTELAQMAAKASADVKPALAEIGQTVAAEITLKAPESDREYYYYKGQKKVNVHITQDVEYKVKKSRKTKENYVSISGGKRTWRKWHLANDGHVDRSGKFVPGNQFADKAVIRSEKHIDNIVDKYIKGVIGDG